MIRALVMTHGDLGIELVRVTEMILGPVPGLTGLTNRGKSAPDIVAEVQRWLAAAPTADGSEDLKLILLDDYGGSCSTGAQLACKGDPTTAIISGVNLAMLLGFVTWRESSDFEELAARIVTKGREAITLVGRR
jgi:mannose/fructose-specific phosphotransferase system component IIA